MVMELWQLYSLILSHVIMLILKFSQDQVVGAEFIIVTELYKII